MSDPWLIVVTVIISVVIIIASIYLLVYFSHPEDKNVAWFPKIVVVGGLSLAAFSILMLPLDVANRNSVSGFPMDELWYAVYISIAAMVVIVIPFAIFYYEGEEAEPGEETPSQIANAIKGTVVTIIVFGVITVVLWITIGIAEIPCAKISAVLVTTNPPTQPEYDIHNATLSITEQTNDTFLAQIEPINCTTYNITIYPDGYIPPLTNETDNVTSDDGEFNVTEITECIYPYSDLRPEVSRKDDQYLKFRVSLPLYIISMVVFFGWVLFIVFGGIGLVALPFDCIVNFQNRPIRITLDQYTKRKRDIGERATKLIEIGKALREKQKHSAGGSRWSRRNERSNYNKFRQSVFFLEADYEHLGECYKRQGGKVILYYLMFLFGMLSVCLTVLWVLQMFLYMFTWPQPFYPFLNYMLIAMDQVFPLFGTVFYGLFAFYLLIATIKGNFKFGMRVFVLFPIHPMRVGGTLMNAFLFNVLLVLVCAVSITQFTAQAFLMYSEGTKINSMFALAVRNLMGLKYIFLAYIYVLWGMILLSALYFAIKPRERPAVDRINVN